MKRSERFAMRARRTALWVLAIISVTACTGVWSVRVWLESPSGGVAGFALTLAGLCLAGGMVREVLHLARRADTEARWEWEREVRPRL